MFWCLIGRCGMCFPRLRHVTSRIDQQGRINSSVELGRRTERMRRPSPVSTISGRPNVCAIWRVLTRHTNTIGTQRKMTELTETGLGVLSLFAAFRRLTTWKGGSKSLLGDNIIRNQMSEIRDTIPSR